MQNVDTVYHLAAVNGTGFIIILTCLDVGIKGILNIMDNDIILITL